MWRNIIPIDSSDLHAFETAFNFRINENMREFLIDHNNGTPSNAIIETPIAKRQVGQFLDFTNSPDASAWKINKRLSDMLGPQRIIIGQDVHNNFIVLCRNYRSQFVAVWSHISNNFEKSIMEIPMLIKYIN